MLGIKLENRIIPAIKDLVLADPEGAEIHSALALLGWGAWVLAPMDTFAGASSFAWMAAVACEQTWALAYLAFGAFQLFAIMFDGRPMRRMGAMGAFMAWAFLALGMALSSPTSVAPVIYLTFTLAQAWTYLRLGRH